MAVDLKVGEEYDVVVENQDHFGRGITRLDNFLVFVNGTLPKEECNIKITNIKKRFATAEVISIKSLSENRIEPKCKYYDSCGGCHIMHQSIKDQLVFKEEKVKDILKKFTGNQNYSTYPIVSKNNFHYRNKVIFHASDRNLGYFMEKSQKLVEIDECLLVKEEIQDIYIKILDYLEFYQESIVSSLMIRHTTLGESMIYIEGDLEQDTFIKKFSFVTSIWINNENVYGREYITEKIYDISFNIYPKSFFQINYDVMLELYKKVMDYYKNNEYKKVLDLYCGTGVIGILVSKFVGEVIGVEIEKSSIQAAKECKKKNNISNISFLLGKVEDHIDSFSDIDSIIVDPPRSGLDSKTIDTILKILPKSISYISCDPVTLARDLKLLCSEYDVIDVHLFDMFPNTYHVETLVFLEIKKQNQFSDYLSLVNKNHLYDENNFKKIVMVETKDIEGNTILVEENTYNHYLVFRDALKDIGIEVSVTSGYRSLKEQEATINELREVYKDDDTLYKKVAPVGASEHHTGLALDITISKKEQFQKRLTDYYNEDELKNRQKTYDKMASICHEYGFILRYPKDKEEITGYRYEPWHFRYVGVVAATNIMSRDIVLEEYLDELS